MLSVFVEHGLWCVRSVSTVELVVPVWTTGSVTAGLLLGSKPLDLQKVQQDCIVWGRTLPCVAPNLGCRTVFNLAQPAERNPRRTCHDPVNRAVRRRSVNSRRFVRKLWPIGRPIWAVRPMRAIV